MQGTASEREVAFLIGIPMVSMILLGWLSYAIVTCSTPSCSTLQTGPFDPNSNNPFALLLSNNGLDAMTKIGNFFKGLGGLVGQIFANPLGSATTITSFFTGLAAFGFIIIGLAAGQLIGAQGQKTCFTIGILLLIWSFIIAFASILNNVPYGLGFITIFVFTFMYGVGIWRATD